MATKTLTELYTELTTYARQTAADNDITYVDAVRTMRDEPGEVARELECSERDVINWCENVSSAAGELA